MAMPSVSKNLNENHDESALPYTATTRTVGPDKHGHLQVSVSYDLRYCDRQQHTLTEWDKRILRPVSEESLWHEPVWLLPIPCYDAQ